MQYVVSLKSAEFAQSSKYTTYLPSVCTLFTLTPRCLCGCKIDVSAPFPNDASGRIQQAGLSISLFFPHKFCGSNGHTELLRQAPLRSSSGESHELRILPESLWEPRIYVQRLQP